jgi:nucleoside-triphosphatase
VDPLLINSCYSGSKQKAFFEATMKKRNILMTGLPGVGKTTLIRKLVEELKPLRPVGFYTEEIREEGTRKGFELISLDGRRGLLAHAEVKGHYRVGKYNVDVKGFEEFLGTVPFLDPSAHLVMIDEIGKMECFSDQFKKLIRGLLDSDKWVIATIALKGRGLIGEVQKRQDVKLFQITRSNRDSILSDILQEIRMAP